MICNGCGAHLIDGTEKCPFCKELLVVTGRNTLSDVTYKIDSPKQFEIIKKSTKSGISVAARREQRRKKRIKRIQGYAILAGMAIVFIAAIVGIISLLISLFSDDVKYTTTFSDNNTISLYYDDDILTLTDNAVNLKTIRTENVSDIISNEGLVAISDDGKTTCIIDNYNYEKKYGTLKVMIKDNAEDIITVSEKVNSNILISENGKHILFIKNGNAKGNRGELWYSKQGNTAVKISDKVDVGKFVFTKDFDGVIYLKDYNYKSQSGDMYKANFDDFSEEKIDKEVYSLYNISKGKNIITYSKNYDSDTGSFDLYVRNEDKAVRLVMGCVDTPVNAADSDYIFVCGDKNDERYNLYRIKPDSLKTEKIISNMSDIVKVSDDGEKVMYSKLFENNVSDYYIWTEGETELKVADGVNYTKENQIAVSDDFEKVAYIANYDENKKGGLLYFCEYNEDSVSVAEKISEDVYSCYVLKNKNIVYNKNYNSKGKTAQLFVYDGIENEINAEINPRFVAIDDNSIICLYDYNSENGGNLYIIDKDYKETKLTSDAYDFYQKANGALIVIRNKDTQTGKFDLYETDDEKKSTILVKKDVDSVIKY